MTCGELIAWLQTYPPETRVVKHVGADPHYKWGYGYFRDPLPDDTWVKPSQHADYPYAWAALPGREDVAC